MNYFVITFQYWNQNDTRIIKSAEACPFKVHNELCRLVNEAFDEYITLKNKQNKADKEGNDSVYWQCHREICQLPDSIKVLDFEVKFDYFISDDWDNPNNFKTQTLTEWAEELYLEQNQ